MSDQNQYVPASPLTSEQTPSRHRVLLADPDRFTTRSPARPGLLLFGEVIVLGALLTGVPGDAGLALTTLAGGAILAIVLGTTLPGRAEHAGAELARRREQFRHEVNAVGDDPVRADLERLLDLARRLNLGDEDVADDLVRIRASLVALTLREGLRCGAWPTAASPHPLAATDTCHFVCPVRFGRRQADQRGHLVLTRTWLSFRGALDMSVAWSEVTSVERVERDLIVGLRSSRRMLRFSCDTFVEAMRGGVIAAALARPASEAGAACGPSSGHTV